MLKGLTTKYPDRPWLPLVQKVRYLAGRIGDSTLDTAVVLTSIDATDGVTAEERQYASEICLAVVDRLPGLRDTPFGGRVKAADGTH